MKNCLNQRTRKGRIVFSSDHKCEKCNKYYINKDALKQHQNRFHQIRKYTKSLNWCNHCSHESKRKSELARHSKIHKSSKEFVFNCETCQKVFAKKHQLSQHIRKVHRESFKCPNCESIYSSGHNMKSHRKHGCISKHNIPWAKIVSTNTKIKRMKLIIVEIHKNYSQLDKIKKLCLYNSLQAMSEDEKETFQDFLDEYYQTNATGKATMTFKDVTLKMKDCWLGMSNTSNLIECDYCGEEVDNKTFFTTHGNVPPN